MDYLDFELCIERGEGGTYPLSVVRSPAGEQRTTIEFPLDEVQLRDRLQTLEIALLKSGSTRRDLSTPDEHHAVEAFGRTLFETLLPAEVRSSYRTSRQLAAREGKGLRLRLRIEAPDLAALPWEFLYDEAEGDFVCLSTDTPLVRYLELGRPTKTVAVDPPLRVLGMIASPGDRATLDVGRERERMSDALRDLEARGLLSLTWLEGQTWRDLQRAMRQGPWHVFHFVGHGGFDATEDEGVLALADDAGATARLPATQLGRLLADHPTLRLAVLNACEGAQASISNLFSSTASVLVRRGIPAVVAMQYEITDEAAIEFSHEFYQTLAEGLPVDAAVAEGRKAVSLSAPHTVEWGTPVLHLRAPDGRLFDIDAAALAPAPVAAAPVAAAVVAAAPIAEALTPSPARAASGAGAVASAAPADRAPTPAGADSSGKTWWKALAGVGAVFAVAVTAWVLLRPGPPPDPVVPNVAFAAIGAANGGGPTPAPLPADTSLESALTGPEIDAGVEADLSQLVETSQQSPPAPLESTSAAGSAATLERRLASIQQSQTELARGAQTGDEIEAEIRELASFADASTREGVDRGLRALPKPDLTPLEKAPFFAASRGAESDAEARWLRDKQELDRAAALVAVRNKRLGALRDDLLRERNAEAPIAPLPPPSRFDQVCSASPSSVGVGEPVTIDGANFNGPEVKVSLGDQTSALRLPVAYAYASPGAYLVSAVDPVTGVKTLCGVVHVQATSAAAPLCDGIVELNTAYFDFGSAALAGDARGRLDENADLLRQCRQTCVEVVGYSDGVEANAGEISRARADAVRRYLVGRGLGVDRVSATARGTDPTAFPKEDPGPGDARARRAEAIPVSCPRG